MACASGGSRQRSRDRRAPPVRVLFVTPYYKPSWGGIERVIAQLSACLLANGHTVGVLTAPYVFPRRFVPDLPAREVIDDGVHIFRLPSRPHRAPPFYSVPLVWFSPRAIADALAEFRPDVIHWVGDGWFLAHFWTWWYVSSGSGSRSARPDVTTGALLLFLANLVIVFASAMVFLSLAFGPAGARRGRRVPGMALLITGALLVLVAAPLAPQPHVCGGHGYAARGCRPITEAGGFEAPGHPSDALGHAGTANAQSDQCRRRTANRNPDAG